MSGIFYNNPTETFVDVDAVDDADWSLHFVSESGVIELFLITPETPLDGFAKYARPRADATPRLRRVDDATRAGTRR